MNEPNQFKIIRKILGAIGLSKNQINEIIETIQSWLNSDEESVAEPSFPYFQRDNFLSAAEHNFFKVLQAATSDWAIICPKVNLGDLFYASTGDYGRNQTYRNKIARKHVDFLLCHPLTIQPMMGIELDDKTHKRSDRRKRDKFVDGVFSAAGLPLIHVIVRPHYNVEKLRKHLETQRKMETVSEVATTAPDQPLCPDCKTPMVLRTAKRGKNAGNQFWGCTNYPKCKVIVSQEIESE